MGKMHDLPYGWYLVSHSDDEGYPCASMLCPDPATCRIAAIATEHNRMVWYVEPARRGKGYLVRTFKTVGGEVLTALSAQGTTATYVDVLERAKAWLPPNIELIYVFMNNLSTYPGTAVLWFSLAHPHWLLAPSCWHFEIV
jgi:hypothetical protein